MENVKERVLEKKKSELYEELKKKITSLQKNVYRQGADGIYFGGKKKGIKSLMI